MVDQKKALVVETETAVYYFGPAGPGGFRTVRREDKRMKKESLPLPFSEGKILGAVDSIVFQVRGSKIEEGSGMAISARNGTFSRRPWFTSKVISIKNE